MLRPCIVALVALVLLAGPALAQELPQDDVMVHVDAGSGALRFLPSEFTIEPGGEVQLMVFGEDHGRYSITLAERPELSAQVDTAQGGLVHVASFAAPQTPGRYRFFDEHHPEAVGVLTVASQAPTIGVGNGYDTAFYPARLEVAPGAAVRFTNNASEIVHTFTFADGSFDTGLVRPGESRELVAPTTPGEHAFLCSFHDGMRGVLVLAGEPQEATRGTPGAPLALALALVALAALMIRPKRS